ncbi:hypothetical protein NN561_007038 [Cricetulus griseus]
METSDDPGLRAPQLGGSLPVMSKCCTQIRSLRLQRPQRANLGLRAATIVPAMPRPTTPGGVLKGLAGTSAWSGPGEQGSCVVEEALRRGRCHRGAWLPEEELLSGRGSAGPAPL